MEHLPKAIRKDISRNEEVEVSDWVKQALDKAVELVIHIHEERLANTLIQQAYDTATDKGCSTGIALAAAFDLFVAAEYYKNVAHRGWYYCPVDDPLLFYPFTNTCPRCVLQGQFHFERANKPESGQIGQATSRLLSIFLYQLFVRAGRRVKIYRGIEPIDLLIYDPQENTVLLSEIKAAPLTTLPLTVPSERLTDFVDGNVITLSSHVVSDNVVLHSSDICMFLPTKRNGEERYRLISLGTVGKQAERIWAYERIEHVLVSGNTVFGEYVDFWIKAFDAYKTTNSQKSNLFWFTNACGQPSPRPVGWPARQRGEGYESVSDGKTSVGMDRTDDIKKGIYQVLKVGAESKPQKSRFQIKTALISNIHAARHYNEYLSSLEDIVWTLDKSGKAKKVSDLPSQTAMYNLFDGIISFTESHMRDDWIEKNFRF